MERDDHLNKLNQKLNSKATIEDIDGLWNELEPRLPKKRKNRFLLFWLAGAAIALLLISVWHGMPKSNAESIEIVNNPNLQEKTQSTNEDVAQINPSLNAITTKNLDTPTEDPIIEPIETTQAPIRSRDNSSATHDTQNRLIKIHNTKITRPNIPTINSPNNTSNQFAINKINETVISKTSITPNTSILTNEILADKLSSNQKSDLQFKLLPILFSKLTATNRRNLIAPKYAISMDNEDPLNLNPWSLSIASYAAMNWQFIDHQATTPLGATLNDLTRPHLGYNYGAVVKYGKIKGLFFGVGIDQSQLTEKFRLTNSISSTNKQTNERAFSFQGEFVAGEQDITTTTFQDVLNYNTLTYTSLVPQVGYTFGRVINYSVGAGPVIRLSQDYSGYLINELGYLTDVTSQYYQNNSIGIGGLSINGEVSKNFGESLSIGLRSQYKWLNKTTAESNLDFKRKVSLFDLGFNLSYRFN